MDLEDNKEQVIIEIELFSPFSLTYFNEYTVWNGENSIDTLTLDRLMVYSIALMLLKAKAKNISSLTFKVLERLLPNTSIFEFLNITFMGIDMKLEALLSVHTIVRVDSL